MSIKNFVIKKFKNLFSIINNFCAWDNVASIGKLKIIQSTYVYFLLIPVVTKALKNINSLTFCLNGKVYEIDLTLPFTWRYFYYASIALVIGNVLYYFFCPKLIRNYKDFDDFVKSGKHKVILHRHLANYYIKRTKSKSLNNMVYFYVNYTRKHNITGYHVPTAMKSLRDYSPIAGSNFVFAIDLLKFGKLVPRIFAMASYITGVLFVLYVILQQTYYALNFLI